MHFKKVARLTTMNYWYFFGITLNYLGIEIATSPGHQRVRTVFLLIFVIEFVENGVQHLSEMSLDEME